jgi:hypothetical protein
MTSRSRGDHPATEVLFEGTTRSRAQAAELTEG